MAIALFLAQGCTEPRAEAGPEPIGSEPAQMNTAGRGNPAVDGEASGPEQSPPFSTTSATVASSSVPMVEPSATVPAGSESTPVTTGTSPSLGGSGGAAAAGEGGTGRGGAAGNGGETASAGAEHGGGGGKADAGTGGAESSRVDDHFTDWPAGAEPAEVGRRLAALFAGKTSDGAKHYKEACSWYGALQVAGLLGDAALLDALVVRYQPYLDSHDELLAGTGHVDENVWGITPLQIFLETGSVQHRADGMAYADHQFQNIEVQIRYAIDDMFMITGLQVQAYRATEDDKYLDLAASTMVSYLDRLQQPDGTFFHHEDVFIKWGRGNGWVASGLTEILRELPDTHPDYARVREGYSAMMQGLLPYRLTEGEGAGLWQQVLDYESADNWPETSGSAMFAYALITGVRLGILDADTFGPVARQAWLGLVGHLEADGRLRGVSDWMWDGTVEDYVARERVTGDDHGQAPMLWAAAALLR
jgi:rhamnogalacturonyl hydrolase YesR